MKRSSTHKLNRRSSIDPNTLILIRQIVLGLLIFGFVGGLLLGVWYGTRATFLTLSDVTITGGETIDHALVRQTVEAELTGTYLGLVPRRFVWAYPKEQIERAILDLPRVKSVVVDRLRDTTLTVEFEEHVPAALWCVDIATTTCAFLDETGYPFAIAPVLSGGDLLRFVSLATSTIAVGSRPFSVEDMTLMMQLRTLLRAADWRVSHIEIDAVRDVFIHIIGGGEFKATLTVPPAQTVANLRTVLTAPEFAELTPGAFSYIDLRFGNKVFVNEVLEVATSTTAKAASSTLGLVDTADAPAQGAGAGDSSSLDEEN